MAATTTVAVAAVAVQEAVATMAVAAHEGEAMAVAEGHAAVPVVEATEVAGVARPIGIHIDIKYKTDIR